MKRLFWDIETSPLLLFSWRIGRKISLNPESIVEESAIICICWKWEDSDEAGSLEWNGGDDRQMLEDFAVVAALPTALLPLLPGEIVGQLGHRTCLSVIMVPWWRGQAGGASRRPRVPMSTCR